jgi:Ca-activated chloride channel family protein
MSKLMRCPICGHLQDEPPGVKICGQCGGQPEYDNQPSAVQGTYLQVQMELEQGVAPAGQNVERHLLVTLRTPKEVLPEEMPTTAQRHPPVNFTDVLDNSGSMQGEKIEQAREAMRQAVHYLRGGDVFSLVTFNNTIACPYKPFLVDDKTSRAVETCLGTIQAGGMTALDGGLERGIPTSLARDVYAIVKARVRKE